MIRSVIIGILAAIGAIFEYWQHKEYHEKHPDYARCPSGVIGFIVISIVSVVYAFTGGN